MPELSQFIDRLPGWALIAIALIYLLDRLGVFAFAKERFTDASEHKQQFEVRQTEHLQKSQGDALSSSLAILDRLIDNLMATNNGRLGKIEERLGSILGTMRKIEGQQTITNRDWSRIEEILADIDLVLHRLENRRDD